MKQFPLVPKLWDQGLDIYTDWCFLKRWGSAMGYGYEDPGATSCFTSTSFVPILYRSLLQSCILKFCIFKLY